jgi:hypothetical protein
MQLPKSPDVSWAGFNVCVWTIVELQLGIICSCAPCLRTFYRCYFSNSRFLRLSSAPKNNKRPGRKDESSNTTTDDQPDFELPAIDEKHMEIDLQTLTKATSCEDAEAYDGSSNGAAGPSAGAADSYQSRSTSERRCRPQPVARREMTPRS